MRKFFIAGNWKMNKTIAEARDLVKGLLAEVEKYENVDAAVCPSYLAVPAVVELCQGKSLKVGAQNLYWEESGAFTGEVSPEMVAEICDYVIVGHSERRAFFGETDETVNKRLKAALGAGLQVIVCVGETLDENEAGKTEEVVTRQIKQGLADISAEQAADITIAYEPVWAIGTGKAATPEDANHVHRDVVRPLLKELFGEDRAEAMRIQYGGSIKPGNAAELFSMSDIDGGLVGGASLKAESFLKILEAASMVAIVQDQVED